MINHYMNLRHILLCLCLLAGITASAYDAEIDGIYYNFSGDEAEVTHDGGEYNSYSGTVVIPESVTYNSKTYRVTSIGDYAFRYCYYLTDISIPNNVKSLGTNAFYNCTRLTSVNLPESLIELGPWAFCSCEALTSLTIPESVETIGQFAISFCSSLKEIRIPKNVKSIWDCAFRGNMFEKMIVAEENPIYDSRDNCNAIIKTATNTLISACNKTIIPSSVTNIGSSAFSYCISLTSITIPEGVTSIGTSAFQGCSGLTSVIIPSSVTSIGSNAFQGCKMLRTSFVNNSSLNSDDNWGAVLIDYITDDGLVISGSVVVGYEGSATSVNIPDGITAIGKSAFSGCKSLTSVNIPNSVTSIDESAFSYCENLTSVVIPKSVISIGQYGFYWCNRMKSVTIGKGVTNIGSGAFGVSSSLSEIIVEEGNIKYDSRNECNAVIETATNTMVLGCKSTIIPESVSSIKDYSFYQNNISSIRIPNNVTSIGKYAFHSCGSLTSVYIMDLMAWCNMYSYPLLDAHQLYLNSEEIKHLVIPNGVKKINERAFYNCTNISSVDIPKSVTYIGGSAFSGCSNLTSVTARMKKPVTIEENTFTNRSNATLYVPIGSKAAYEAADYWKEFKEIIETDLLVPENVEISGIYYCIDKERKVAEVIPSPDDNLYSGNITIPSSVTYNGETYNVTSIGEQAFVGCKELSSITLPNSVTYIGLVAFMGCTGLTSVNIPNSVNSIDEGAFCGCENLTSIIIPEGVTYIGPYAFLGCSGLTRITIPGSVSVIEDITFSGCSGLTSITISEGVTTILPYAFGSCSSLTSITLPSSLTIIDEVAFGQCSSLKDVYCYAENVPETSPFAFDGSPIETATLHVPASALEAYKTTEPWSGFGVFDPIMLKCGTPTIGYANGKLTFKCETEDVAFIYNIKDDDIKYGAGSEVDLCVAYQISVYATKGGIANSDVATATLCWVDQQPEAEGLTDEDAVLEMKALPVLVQTQGSTITVQGAANGTQIYVYATDGMQQATAIAVGGGATLNTSLQPGSVAIVKIGERTIKVLMK